MPKKPTDVHAIRYLHDAMRYQPDATPREIRQELRRRLKADGFGWLQWVAVIVKILATILPLLFSRPKA